MIEIDLCQIDAIPGTEVNKIKGVLGTNMCTTSDARESSNMCWVGLGDWQSF